MLTAEQIAERRTGLGGTDAAAILGLSPWRTPLQVWREKTGQEQPSVETDAMRWGQLLEDVVAEEYARQTGRKIRRVRRTLRHPTVRVALAHLDREIVADDKGPGVLEVKTTWARTDEWGEEGTDEVPAGYAAQVTHYLAVTGRRWGEIAVLWLRERRLGVYRIEPEPDVLRGLLEYEQEWWERHVEAGVPPEPRSTAEAASLWPQSVAEQVVADRELESAAARLAAVRAQIRACREEEERLRLQLQKALGAAEELVAPDGRVLATWKTAKPSRVIDWGGVVEELGPMVGQDRVEEAVSRNTRVRPGARRFILKLKAEQEGSDNA